MECEICGEKENVLELEDGSGFICQECGNFMKKEENSETKREDSVELEVTS